MHAVAAIQLLMLTGCRKTEILTLRWEDVDLAANELRLADSKTGPRTVALSPPASDRKRKHSVSGINSNGAYPCAPSL